MNGWEANLELVYASRSGRSSLTGRKHHGPLTIQRSLYPEGPSVCHNIILHPPGGVAGGDRLQLGVDVQSGSHALLTTPGAAKWYRSTGPQATQRVVLQLAAGAILEWLPQESIFFNAARVQSQTEVQLQGDAVFLGWDISCFGRTAGGERFSAGQLRQLYSIRRDGRLLWHEQSSLAGGDAALAALAGLAGRSVTGTLVLAAESVSTELLASCRAVGVDEAAGSRCGVTQLPGVLLARFIGHRSEEARHYFTALWQLLRPAVIGREASVPRIWHT